MLKLIQDTMWASAFNAGDHGMTQAIQYWEPLPTWQPDRGGGSQTQEPGLTFWWRLNHEQQRTRSDVVMHLDAHQKQRLDLAHKFSLCPRAKWHQKQLTTFRTLSKCRRPAVV